MANAFYGDRFVIDTAGATLLNQNLAQLPLPLKVQAIHWVGATTNDHDAEIQDADSNPLWVDKQPPSGVVSIITERVSVLKVWRTDFKVTTLDSGTLYIYLDV